MFENPPASNMINVIDAIRNCNSNCYTDRYKFPLKTRDRIISVDELLRGKPLIDDWRDQKVLFISQAPSKQAWVDHELSSLENSFFSDILLPKVSSDSPKEAFEIWKNIVFWAHTANCYPYIFTEGRNENRDQLPDLRCANKYMDQIIYNMEPRLIVLMGVSSTKFFAKSLRELIGSKKAYPSLEEILNWQKENQSTLLIKSKNRNSKYRAVAIPHAANWGKLTDSSKFGYELFFQLIREIYTDFR